MLEIKTTLDYELPFTSIPNKFIDQYMSDATPAFVVVYIYFLRHMGKNSNITTEQAANDLGILESDIIRALKYWSEKRVLNYYQEENEVSIVYNCCSDKEKVETDAYEQLGASEEVAPEKKEELQEDNAEESKPILNVVDYKPKNEFEIKNKPNYSLEELEIYRTQSNDIKNLFKVAENTLGKLLTYNDMNTIFSFYDWLRLPLEVIELLILYCAQNNHRNMSYIERCAVDWAENGINSIEAANEYIKIFNKDFREIFKALGLGNRNPAPTEIEYMNRWIQQYKMPLNIILEACDKTIMQISKPQFSYTEKIIKEWFDNKVRTLDDIKKFEANYYETKKLSKEKSDSQKSAKNKAPVKQNRFVNFKQREWDYEQIERLERKYLESSVAEAAMNK